MLVNSKMLDLTFSAADVAFAAGCSEHALTNYISKNRLELCSLSSGQGRRREFPIVDVFQVALMTTVVGLCNNAQHSALICSGELFKGVDQQFFEMNERYGRDPTTEEIARAYERLAAEFRTDLRAAPRYFHEINIDSPWVLLFEIFEDGRLPRTDWLNWSEPLTWSRPDLTKGFYLNATHAFACALERLEQRVA